MTGGTRQFKKPLLIDTLRLVARAKEDERLRALVLSGISIDAIAALMKRSAAAVRDRAARLSIVVANLRRFSHFFTTDPTAVFRQHATSPARPLR